MFPRTGITPIPIFKKGDDGDFKNYLLVSLKDIAGKILVVVLVNMLEKRESNGQGKTRQVSALECRV